MAGPGLADHTQPITGTHVNAAKDPRIQRRGTYLDSLANKIHKHRVTREIGASPE